MAPVARKTPLHKNTLPQQPSSPMLGTKSSERLHVEIACDERAKFSIGQTRPRFRTGERSEESPCPHDVRRPAHLLPPGRKKYSLTCIFLLRAGADLVFFKSGLVKIPATPATRSA